MSELEHHDVPEGVDTAGWTLEVRGSVDQPLQFERSDLAEFPVETVTEDFSCVEGWTAEGLSWGGIPIGLILDRAGPTSRSERALVHAMDGDYAPSFVLPRLADSLLALELDGEPLALEHGGPARLIPADTDSECWESIKWVSEIEITESPTPGDSTAEDLALERVDRR